MAMKLLTIGCDSLVLKDISESLEPNNAMKLLTIRCDSLVLNDISESLEPNNVNLNAPRTTLISECQLMLRCRTSSIQHCLASCAETVEDVSGNRGACGRQADAADSLLVLFLRQRWLPPAQVVEVSFAQTTAEPSPILFYRIQVWRLRWHMPHLDTLSCTFSDIRFRLDETFIVTKNCPKSTAAVRLEFFQNREDPARHE